IAQSQPQMLTAPVNQPAYFSTKLTFIIIWINPKGGDIAQSQPQMLTAPVNQPAYFSTKLTFIIIWINP
ncbi:hypothetical protein R5L36_20380, partial [Acinetobacter baumannii]|nr:hypothetical protein [Acinetobacter baumannii]